MEWSAECCGYPIVVQAWRAGGDLQVLITGGVRRHIGSVSVAWQTKEGVRVQDTTLPGHKDGIVGSRFARCLTEKLGCTVAVSCGIHYDGPTPRDLEHIVASTDRLLEQMVDTMEKETGR